MKLLATRIVANNFLGRSRSFEMILNFLGFSSSPRSISDLLKEKKATSTPLISAEQNSKIIITISSVTESAFVLSMVIIKLVGSGSNVIYLNNSLIKTGDHQHLRSLFLLQVY